MCTSDPSHRKRCKRHNIYGHAHYLTFSCFGRQPFLARDRTRQWLLDAIRAAKVKHPFDLWAFVIMPEHAHLLVFPHEPATISGILKSVKQPVAQRALRWVQRNTPAFLPSMADKQPNGQIIYRFWLPGGGYDRNIWSLPEVMEKVRYIHENPLRRGLTDRAAHWPWSSWRAWECGVDEPLPIDKDSLPWVSG